MLRSPLAAAAVFALSVPAGATEYDAALQDFLDTEMRQWAESPLIVDALIQQNALHAGLDRDRILELDRAWRADVGDPGSPIIAPVLNGPLAVYLRNLVDSTNGMVTEIFVMDDKGLNVAVSHITSDYWQGDEPKYQQTYARGADGVHISEIEFDESSQRFQGQISITLTDPASGAPIGAMTVGVDAEALM
ncbi:hypothetical protein [Histidinibacterium aquaticum]|uniref:Uncharacterized protein n=1 Tax=Histidinibacterium aquaticum TaxID=2613962 RepID=A0A5J5GJ82_9RHOB|nr:hypothetical protein [Histidinibacterium aquaticum]KAA9008177.1 hypothetical protein F3S47_11810 [Histidinibacterium aquaticum]